MSRKEVHCGWLTKRGGVRRNWKQRWFIIHPDKQMKYFETGKADKCLGTIDLNQVLSLAPCDEKGVRAHSLSLTTQDRVWVLAAESSESLEKWLHMLEVCVGTAKRLVTTKEGFLMKKGKLNTNWKTRFFALGKGWLFYFAQEEDCQKFKKIAFFSEKVFRLAFFKYVSGSIPLEQAVIERWGDSMTRITVSTPQRVYHIIAKSERELDGWIQAIHKSVGKFKAQKRSDPPNESLSRKSILEESEEQLHLPASSPRATQAELDLMAKEMNELELEQQFKSAKQQNDTKAQTTSKTTDGDGGGSGSSSVELETKQEDSSFHPNHAHKNNNIPLRLSKVEFESDDEDESPGTTTTTTTTSAPGGAVMIAGAVTTAGGTETTAATSDDYGEAGAGAAGDSDSDGDGGHSSGDNIGEDQQIDRARLAGAVESDSDYDYDDESD